MPKSRRHVTTAVVVIVFALANILALKWSWKYFQNPLNARVSYGDRMPSLAGADYTGRQTLSVNPKDLNLVLYLSGPSLNGRSVSVLKSAESLQREHAGRGLNVSVITGGVLREVQELMQDGLITYKVINDSDGTLARRLGLDAGDTATFLFDAAGSCKFSVRQEVNSDDLHQLLGSEGVVAAAGPATGEAVVGKGKPLPSWKLVEARTLKPASIAELAAGQPRQWVFFPADCFSCGVPDLRAPLAEFDYWRKSAAGDSPEPILVFDSAFLPATLVRELGQRKIGSPVYVSNDELSQLVKLAQAKGKKVGRPMIVSTDASGTVLNVSMVKPPEGAAPPAETAKDADAAGGRAETFQRAFANLNLDVYDVDSHKNLYVVSERSRNSVLVINERSEIQKVISGIGSEPGRLFRPGHLDVASDGVVYVQDGGNERVQSFDLEGRYLGGFATTQYMGFAAGAGGEVYLGQPEKGALVTVYSRDGKVLRSFGKPKTMSEVYGAEYAGDNEVYRNAINRVRLTTEDDGSILVSFALAPLLQKYSREGNLIFERRLEGPEIDRLTRGILNDTGGNLVMSIDGFPERIMSLEAVSVSGGEINVILTDGSVYVADREGRKVNVIRPPTVANFTPEMAGVSPAGELMLVTLSPRYCYFLSRQAG